VKVTGLRMTRAATWTARILLLCGAALALLSWLAARVPARPKNLPPGALFIPSAPEPFEFSPHGLWVGCWQTGFTNRCIVTSAGGEPEYDGEFLPLQGVGPIPENQLHPVFREDAGHLWTWSERLRKSVPIVCLANGVILLPSEDFDELKSRFDGGLYASRCQQKVGD
jgi:hypothetical protein